MATDTLHRQIRFLDVARAFGVLANHADKALDLAVEVSDDTIKVLESNVHNIAAKLNGDPVAAEIAALLSHPFHESPTIAFVPGSGVGDKERTHGTFTWRAVENPNAVLGNKHGAFICNWQGLKLEISKLGPARYEGRINDVSVVQGKFKKSVREKLEKEATKRAG